MELLAHSSFIYTILNIMSFSKVYERNGERGRNFIHWLISQRSTMTRARHGQSCGAGTVRVYLPVF